MEYFNLLHLKKEPFSNSPDPDLFFQSRQHVGCLQRLEISLRLRRGLNVVIGDVGTGKTTLCRQLIRRLASDKNMEVHLILDPFFRTSSEALMAVSEMFGKTAGDGSQADITDRHIRETIKQFLFRKGVEEKKNIVLIIDEGQKIPGFFMEILREFLNYETNEHKLLQIVIFAQMEFKETLAVHANFADRISLYDVLSPLNFREMKEMIRFRLKQAGAGDGAVYLFTYPALREIYRVTKGYPRKIINLCHQSLLMMIIQNRSGIGWSLIRVCAGRGLYGTEPEKNISPMAKSMLLFFSGICVCLLLIGVVQYRSVTNIREIFRWGGLYAENTGKTASHLPAESLKTQKGIKEFPDSLGQLSLNSGETLGELVRMVYGTASPRILETVLARNPHIGNLHRIPAGQRIVFPAIFPDGKPGTVREYLIEIYSYSDFETAIGRMRSHAQEQGEAVRLIPCWNFQEKLKFFIILDEYFPDEPSARQRLNRLPPGSGAKIRSPDSWDRNTVFLAGFSGQGD
ncbi:MAG: AAA family ATPase [Desulfococcaceae bacterium]